MEKKAKLNNENSIYRNPNEQQDNRDRGKVKNVEWTAYESVHKKYLNIGEFSIIFTSILILLSLTNWVN